MFLIFVFDQVAARREYLWADVSASRWAEELRTVTTFEDVSKLSSSAMEVYDVVESANKSEDPPENDDLPELIPASPRKLSREEQLNPPFDWKDWVSSVAPLDPLTFLYDCNRCHLVPFQTRDWYRVSESEEK